MNDSGSYVRLSLETSLALERARLVRLCAKITGDRIIAEDLAQETLLEAWRHIDNLRSQDKLPQWLSGIAHKQMRRGSPRVCNQGRKRRLLFVLPLAFWSRFQYTTRKNRCSMIGDRLDGCPCCDSQNSREAHSLLCV